MSLNPYLNFNGNCREAVEFYSLAFETQPETILTFGDMPETPEFILPSEAKSLIMHTNLKVFGSTLMFSDVLPSMPYIHGNSISLAIVIDDEKFIQRIFNRLKEGGTIEMDLQKTEWSNCYGALIDKFGVSWQLNQQHDN